MVLSGFTHVSAFKDFTQPVTKFQRKTPLHNKELNFTYDTYVLFKGIKLERDGNKTCFFFRTLK